MNSEHMARADLIVAARAVAERGLSHGSTGNVSVRVDDRILITPTASSLATVAAEDLALLDLDGRRLTDAVPSKEAFLHSAIYRNRPRASAIVHTHSLYATAVSCLADIDPDDALPPLTAYYAMRVEALPLVDYCPPGDARLADLAGKAARTSAAILLRNHGPVVAAPDPAMAVDVIEEIEQMARIFLLVAARDTAPLPAIDRARLYAHSNRDEGK